MNVRCAVNARYGSVFCRTNYIEEFKEALIQVCYWTDATLSLGWRQSISLICESDILDCK